MKKWFGLALALLVSLSACADRTASSSSEPLSEPPAVSSEPSEPEPVSVSEPASESVPADGQAVTAAVTKKIFTFDQFKKSYQVAYPEFSEVKNADSLNAALKAAGMKDADQNGYRVEYDERTKKPMAVSLKTDYEITRQNSSFVSVLFVTNCSRNDEVSSGRTTRTVNFCLKTGKSLSTGDILKENDEFAVILWKEIQKDAPPEVLDSLSWDALRQLLPATPVYMTPDGIGFTIEVSHAAGDFYQVVVPLQKIRRFVRIDFFS
jgi:hypothetical protein